MAQFRKLYGQKVSFVTIPEDGDGLDVWYGRGVGWGVEEIEVPGDIVKISGTALRLLERTTIWFTGIPCSGKTTLAQALKPELEAKGIFCCSARWRCVTHWTLCRSWFL